MHGRARISTAAGMTPSAGSILSTHLVFPAIDCVFPGRNEPEYCFEVPFCKAFRDLRQARLDRLTFSLVVDPDILVDGCRA